MHYFFYVKQKFSDLNFNIPTYLLFTESRNLGSSWISGENRPEYWTTRWRYYYADGEPNFSGNCVYLSKSWYVVLHSNLDIHFGLDKISTRPKRPMNEVRLIL